MLNEVQYVHNVPGYNNNFNTRWYIITCTFYRNKYNGYKYILLSQIYVKLNICFPEHMKSYCLPCVKTWQYEVKSLNAGKEHAGQVNCFSSHYNTVPQQGPLHWPYQRLKTFSLVNLFYTLHNFTNVGMGQAICHNICFNILWLVQ